MADIPDIPHVLSRAELYDLVWSTPMRTLARGFRMSDVALGHLCDRLRVPHPPRGHWAKHAAGQSTTQPPLPAAVPGDLLEWRRDGRSERRCPCPTPTRLPAKTARGQRRDLISPRPEIHPVLNGSTAHFAVVRHSKSGYLRPTKRHLVDVFVTQALLPRALAVANDLFLALNDHGYAVQVMPGGEFRRPPLEIREKATPHPSYDLEHWAPSGPTVVMLGTTAFALTIYEPSIAVEMRLVNGEYVQVGQEPARSPRSRDRWSDWTTTKDIPSGRLAVRACSPYQDVAWEHTWREAAVGDLPEMAADLVSVLAKTVATIVARVEARDRAIEAARIAQEESIRRWRTEEDRKRAAEAETASRDALVALAEAWAGRVEIEMFLADAERCVETDEERAAVAERIQIARALLNSQTPLQRLLAWSSPAERLKAAGRGDLAGLAPAAKPAGGTAFADAPPAARTLNQMPTSFWSSRGWWHHW